jgi:ABC-type sugar transport system permease subunit
MDVWHWTSLVVLLCYAGLVAIPNDYYQAAKIDGASAWAVFRFIQLPKLKRVLTIAILLRFMDSFMIYTEVQVLTGGGPGTRTTFLSIDLFKVALGQFDLGPAGRHVDRLLPDHPGAELGVLHAHDAERGEVMRKRSIVPILYIVFLMLPIYWLVTMSFKTTNEILGSFTLWPPDFTLDSYRKIFTDSTWYMGYVASIEYVVVNTILSGGGGLAGRLCVLALPASSATSTVLLAADQPHGAAGGVRAAVLSALLGGPAVRHAVGRGAAHTLFNIRSAVWILEGFMSGVPKELDETAYVDGYSFSRFFFQDLHADHSGRYRRRLLLLLHVLVGRAAAGQDPDLGRGQADRRADDQDREHSGYQLGLLAAAGTLTLIPARGDLFRAQLHRQGLCPRRV